MMAAILTGCGSEPKEDRFALEDVNVLMIVIDTLGTGHLGTWTPGLDTSPNIDALAASGIRFTRASSTAPWTQPAVASLMTGLTPSHHGVLHLFDKLPEDHLTLAEALAARGFKTAGVVSHFLINRDQGYGQGFEVYTDASVKGHQVSSPKVTRTAISELRRLQDERFFLFVHYFDPHSEYLHHPEYDRTSWYQGSARQWGRDILTLREKRQGMKSRDIEFLRDLYREEITFTDYHIGLLMAQLKNLGLDDNTLVILTADHGEEFMEHGWIGHTRFLYDTLLHVPLVFRLPGKLEPGTVTEPVSLNDLMPTLLGLSQKPSEPADGDGRSLWPFLTGAEGKVDHPLFSEVSFLAPPKERGTIIAEKEAFMAAVTDGDWKLIHDLDRERWSLFDRSTDPGEIKDLFNGNHPRVRKLQPLLLEWEKGKVDKWGRNFEGIKQMSEEDRNRLRSLGYVR
jgi:arylsulfatase A-like enzyme